MAGNVIGIVGSPRKGFNTDTLVQAVLDGAKDEGTQATKYYLTDLNYVRLPSASILQGKQRMKD